MIRTGPRGYLLRLRRFNNQKEAHVMRSDHSSPCPCTRIAAATLMAVALLSACGKKDAARPAPAAAGGSCRRRKSVSSPPNSNRSHCRPNCRHVPSRSAPPRSAPASMASCSSACSPKAAIVKQGQSLFQIDPAPYQAQAAAAQADLGRAQATLTQAAARPSATSRWSKPTPISKQEYTNAVAAQKQAEAAVAAARAQVRIAQINSGYANVNAPISGRIGRALVTEGALVSATEATEMALIQQTDPMYLNITQSATELQRLRKQAGGGSGRSVPVTVMLDDGTELPPKGRLLFSDVTVDPSTGQVTLRAQVRTRTTPCCRASTCACAWRRPGSRTASWCRSRPSPAAAPRATP